MTNDENMEKPFIPPPLPSKNSKFFPPPLPGSKPETILETVTSFVLSETVPLQEKLKNNKKKWLPFIFGGILLSAMLALAIILSNNNDKPPRTVTEFVAGQRNLYPDKDFSFVYVELKSNNYPKDRLWCSLDTLKTVFPDGALEDTYSHGVYEGPIADCVFKTPDLFEDGIFREPEVLLEYTPVELDREKHHVHGRLSTSMSTVHFFDCKMEDVSKIYIVTGIEKPTSDFFQGSFYTLQQYMSKDITDKMRESVYDPLDVDAQILGAHYSMELIYFDGDNSQSNVNEENNEITGSIVSGYGNTAANISAGGFAAIQDDWIYYAGVTGLYRIKTDDSDKQQLEEGTFLYFSPSINVIGEWLFYWHPAVGLHRIKIDGTNKEQLSDARIPSFLIKDGWIYFCDIDNSNYLYRMRIDGKGDKQVLIRNPFGIDNHIEIIGDWIYFIDQKSILWRVKTDGFQSQKLTQVGSHGKFQIVGDRIYFIQDGRLFQKGIDGSNLSEINENITVLYEFQVIADEIYYTDSSSLFCMKIDGSGNQKLMDSAEGINFFNIVDDWIYYEGSNDGSLYRVKTDGSCNELVDKIGNIS